MPRTKSKTIEDPTSETTPKPSRRAAKKQEPVKEEQPTEAAKTAKRPRKLFGAPDQPSLPIEPPTEPKPRSRKQAAISEQAEDELPIPIWRAPAKPAASAVAPPASEEREAPSGQTSRPRRGRARASAEGESPQEVEVSFRKRSSPKEQLTTPTPEPEPRTREVVATPEDAPQIAMLDGVPTLVRQGRVYPPLFFFGNALDARRADTVFEQAKLASEHGVHLFTFLVEFQVDPASVDEAVKFAGYLARRAVEADSEAQVLFRIVFTAPPGWEQKFPKAKFVAETGGAVEPSICEDGFWQLAEDCLGAFIRKLRKLPLQDHLLGLHLERGEWFFSEEWGYDTSVAAQEKFREWVRFRYRGDVVSLRSAWFDGQVQFDTIAVPEFGHEPEGRDQFVRTGRRARRWVDYHLFLSDVTVERIGKLAQAVKRESEGRFIAGVSYGYTFEWSHPASAHLSLGKLLRTPEIDFVAGPPSYQSREPGGTAAFPGPIDSVALNGKLYISEEDFKTPISGRQEPDDFNPVMRTPQALESVHWRGGGAALAHLGGVCWMDLWGNGWLSSPGIWSRAQDLQRELLMRRATSVTEPEVAVFIDERSLAYLFDRRAFKLLVGDVREAVMRAGLSVGFYLLSDLAHRERFPESKLYVFMNAWDIRPEVRSAIKARLHRDGKTLFWLYAAGLFDGGRDSLERVREVTGIALKPQPFASKPGSTILSKRHPLSEALPERTISGGGQLEPSYFAIPEDGIVLGEYSQTGLPSFVLCNFTGASGGWKSVFLGEPVVTPALFRALGALSGAHVWNYHDDVVHVRAPFLTIHATGTGSRTLTLPDKWSAYDLIAGDWAVVDSMHLRFNAVDGSTNVFLVGLKEELEHLLASDPSELQTIESVPPRPENTLSLDSFNFDVPIMRLDEWIEESSSDDVIEELLFKAPPFDLEEEPQTVNERGVRERRRRRPRRASDSPARGTVERVDDMAINVMFRKRE